MATIDRLRTEPMTTADEVAELAGVSPATVLRWARDGDLPSVKLSPRVVRFRSADVLAFLGLEAA